MAFIRCLYGTDMGCASNRTIQAARRLENPSPLTAPLGMDDGTLRRELDETPLWGGPINFRR